MVGPTNRNPRRRSSLLKATDSGDVEGDILFAGTAVVDGLTANEGPDELGEASSFLLQVKHGPGIANGGIDFLTAAYYVGVFQHLLDFLVAVLGNPGRIEAVKSAAVTFPLVQDGLPAQARLRSFQDEKLEQLPVIP